MGSFQGHCHIREGGHHFPFSVSSTRFSLSSSQCSSSVQRSPPTRSRTDRVQHIQGCRSTSPHPSLRRVRVLSCSCPVVISPYLVPPSLFPSCNGKSWVSVLRVSGAMHASLASQHKTLPYFHSMLNQPTGMLRDMCLCTDSWEIWPCTVVSLSEAVFMVEWEVLWLNFNWSYTLLPKKERIKVKTYFQPQQLWLTLHGWLIWKWAKQSCVLWFAIMLLVLFISLFYDGKKMDTKEAGWESIQGCWILFSPAHTYQVSIQM